MSSAFSKSSVFVCPHVQAKTAFSKSSTLESVFEKFRFHRIRVTEAVSVKKMDTCKQELTLDLLLQKKG